MKYHIIPEPEGPDDDNGPTDAERIAIVELGSCMTSRSQVILHESHDSYVCQRNTLCGQESEAYRHAIKPSAARAAEALHIDI